MPKRLIGFFNGDLSPAKVMDIRYGGLPLLIRYGLGGQQETGSNNSVAVSPDQSYLVFGSVAGAKMFVYNDPAVLGLRTSPAVSFAGTVTCCAASNTHYAFGGTSPFLYVFERATGALATVSNAGLGSLAAMDFSPDGTKLAVCHLTSPYLRIYNVSDWSFINPSSPAGSSPGAICFSHDSSKVVVNSTSSPTISVFNSTTGVRGYTSTSNLYAASTNNNAGSKSARSPMDARTILFACATAPAVKAFKFDTSTNTPTAFTGLDFAQNCFALTVDPDPAEDSAYIQHGSGGITPVRTITKVKISTGTMHPDMSNPEYVGVLSESLHGGAYGSTVGLGIVFTKPHTLTGTVRDFENNPAARRVRAFRRSTGELAAQTLSDPVTGDYSIRVFDAGPYDIQFLTEDGELLNDLFYARAEPQAI